MLIVLQLLMLSYLSGCGNSSQSSELLRVIGSPEFEPVGETTPGKKASLAIGKMRRGCTVTHIGQGLALTAAHCFLDEKEPSQSREISCDSWQFDTFWGNPQDSEGPIRAKCVRIHELHYNDFEDFALFQIDRRPKESVECVSQAPASNAILSIFSHPRGRALEWSNFCKLESYTGDEEKSFFTHGCDTEAGSSGAGIFDENFRLVGLHLGFDDELRLNIGSLLPFSQINCQSFSWDS